VSVRARVVDALLPSAPRAPPDRPGGAAGIGGGLARPFLSSSGWSGRVRSWDW
jgi:hypothetical protein